MVTLICFLEKLRTKTHKPRVKFNFATDDWTSKMYHVSNKKEQATETCYNIDRS
jgi:hypothetical protein